MPEHIRGSATALRRLMPKIGACLLITVALTGGAGEASPSVAAPSSSSIGQPASAPAETKSGSTERPDPAAQAAAFTRLGVLAVGFAVAFITIGVIFFRMVRRSRLD